MPGATTISTIVIPTSLRLWANYVVLYHTGNNDNTTTGIASMPILGILLLMEEHLILQHYRIRWSCGRLIMKGRHETNAAITRRRGLTDWIRRIRPRIQHTHTHTHTHTQRGDATTRFDLYWIRCILFFRTQDKTKNGVIRLSFIVVSVAPDMASWRRRDEASVRSKNDFRSLL